MAPSNKHRGWLLDHDKGILAAVYNGAQPGTTSHLTNTALGGILLGTPVTPALAVDSLVISNMVASGDILVVANNGGNSQAWLWVDASAGTMTLYGAGTAAAVISATSIAAALDVTLASGTGLNVGSTTQATISNGDGATNLIPEVQALGVGTAFAGGALLLGTFNATNDRTVSPKLAFLKGAAATQVATTAVANDEVIGSIIAYGSDSADFETPVAAIEFVVDDAGGPGASAIGGSIEFYTTADGGSTLTKALTLGTDQSATFAGVIVLPSTASINGTTSITINDNSGDVDFIVESNDDANMFTIDAALNAIGIRGAAVSGQTLTITNAAMAATGRVLKLSATATGAALTDGYGAFEVDVTLSGSPTDHSAAASAWINITGGTVPAGTYICARNDGIYEATAATITNAKLIFGARMQYLADDTDGLRFPWSINTNNAAITALIDVNNITDLGTVANAGATAATLLPILRTASGTLKYVLLYDLQ